jgi:anti-sigma regulatory factor (Ser/Thr protein kinase)
MFNLETRDDLVATATYQPELTAAAAARRFVRDTLRSWDLTGYPGGLRREDMRDGPGAPDGRPGTGASGVRYVPGPTDVRVVPSPRDEVAARDVREVRGSREEAKPRDVRERPSPEDGRGARGAPGARDRAGASGALDALVDDAVLLTSELVTNAVLHAGTPVQVTCRLLADASIGGTSRYLDGWVVEIAVLDRRPALLRTDLPRSAAEAAERVSGRGLLLPAELASAWGVTYARAAKAVWFRMALPEPESEPAAGSCPGPGLAGQR